MEEYSCTPSGLTAMGFYQILNKKYKPSKIIRKLRRFGINENFYSVKSSIFMISFHSELPIHVITKDAVKTDLNERSRDMLIDFMVTNNQSDIEKLKVQEEFELSRIKHKDINAVTYFFTNNSDGELTVDLDMTDSLNCYFSPTSGKAICTVEAGQTKYIAASLCSCMAEDKTDDDSFKYNLDVKDITK